MSETLSHNMRFDPSVVKLTVSPPLLFCDHRLTGHGATVIAPDLRAAVFRAVYAVHNAQILLQTMAAAPGQSISFLAEGECASATASNASQADRPWNVWSSQIDYP